MSPYHEYLGHSKRKKTMTNVVKKLEKVEVPGGTKNGSCMYNIVTAASWCKMAKNERCGRGDFEEHVNVEKECKALTEED